MLYWNQSDFAVLGPASHLRVLRLLLILPNTPLERLVSVVAPQKFAYLTMTVGSHAGEHFLLDRFQPNRLGRGDDCQIMLPDPLCSRVHAEVIWQGDQWMVRDVESRNGTYVNDQKIDEAVLDDGHNMRVGSVEFEFHLSDQPPTVIANMPDAYTQTIVRESPVGESTAAERHQHFGAGRDSRFGAGQATARALSAQHQAVGLPEPG